MKDLISNFYELWGAARFDEFSEIMHTQSLYFPVVLYSILVALILTITYYYIIDRPNTAKLGMWLGNILLGAILSFVIAFVSSNNDLTEILNNLQEEMPPSYTSYMLFFSIINAMWTMLLMFFLSMLFKWKSTHSSYIPF